MLVKLAILVLATAATAAGLLSVRQQRLQTVHDTHRAVQEAAALDRTLWELRAELASLTAPDRVEQLLEHSTVDAWIPIHASPPEPANPPEGAPRWISDAYPSPPDATPAPAELHFASRTPFDGTRPEHPQDAHARNTPEQPPFGPRR